MHELKEYFDGYPSQLAVAEMFLRLGISVHDGDAYVGNVKQSDSAVARAAGVDRRVARSTIERIEMYGDLSEMFSRVRCIADLSDAAALLGDTAIEIVPDDDSRPGVMAGIMNIISDLGLNIKQAIVSSPDSNGRTHLIITISGGIPPSAITSIHESPGVAQVILR